MNALLKKSPAIVALCLGSLCLALLSFSSCATSAVSIPEDLSPAEIIQRAQEASDRNRYSIALQHYEALLERNSANAALVCTAEYHIAFINHKQRRHTQAREGFTALLQRFNGPGGELLPQHYRILAETVLARIDEIEQQRRPFSRFR